MDELDKIKLIRRAIVEAIAFFDIFDFPLTAFEIRKYSETACDLSEIIEALADERMQEIIEQKNGFYFLSGREKIYVTRMKRYNYANAKFKKALRIARIFKFIPWIKMIAIGNMLGANNLKQESDIDLFIITTKKKIWLTRFFCVAIAELLRLRPKANNFRDKICLSFFVSEEALDLTESRLNDDTYFLYWLADLTPIYNVNDTYRNFIVANSWVQQKLPNWEPMIEQRMVKSGEFIFYQDFIDVLLGGLEPFAKKQQLKILPQSINEIINKDTRVMVDDKILKLHANDRRAEFNKLFREKTKLIYEQIK